MKDNIFDMIPQRYPFLMVDRVISIKPNEEALAIKNVSYGESWTQGHFPNEVIMPGNLILESMAQTAMLLVSHESTVKGNNIGYLLSINKVKFRQQVRPGDCLLIDAKMLCRVGNNIQVTVKCSVLDELVTEGELLLSVSK